MQNRFSGALPHRLKKELHGEGLRNHSNRLAMRSYRLHSISGLFLPTDSDNRSGLKRPNRSLPFRKLRKDYERQKFTGPFSASSHVIRIARRIRNELANFLQPGSVLPVQQRRSVTESGFGNNALPGDVRLSTRPLYPDPGRLTLFLCIGRINTVVVSECRIYDRTIHIGYSVHDLHFQNFRYVDFRVIDTVESSSLSI